ncbi:MAG: serine hydrolase [Limisphaerales bacterium]
MKTKLALSMLGIASAGHVALAGVIADAPLPGFDPNLFRTAATTQFDGFVKGYQLAVVKDGVILGWAADGVAVDRDDARDPMPMNVSVPMNVGSNVKMVSAVALLSFFEKDTSRTVSQWLDENVIDYMPQLWRNTFLGSSDPWKQAVANVTFRHILQHKSGIDDDKNIIDDGVNPANLGIQRNYHNNNFTLIRICLPYLVDPFWGQQLDQAVANRNATDLRDEFLDGELQRWFRNYMQAEVFDRVEVEKSPAISLPDGQWKSHLRPGCSHETYVTAPIVSLLKWGLPGDVPLLGDMDGDGTDDFVVWRPSTGQWFVRSWTQGVLVSGLSWGIAGDKPLVGDVDGDGAEDLVMWRPSNGKWYAKKLNGAVILTGLSWGVSGDIPLLGNVDVHKSDDELVIYRPSTKRWFAKRANGTVVFSNRNFALDGSYQPLLADPNGDEILGPVAWRPAEGEFEVTLMTSTTTLGTKTVSWGKSGDILLAGDMDGDSRDEFVVYRPSTHQWWCRDLEDRILFQGMAWGAGVVTPLLGDIDGDGQDDLVTFRNNTGRWSAAGRRYAMGYPNVDADAGIPVKHKRDPIDECNSAGGYWFSSVEYAAWAATFGGGGTFVSQAVRDLMFDDSSATTRDNRLGWQTTLDTDNEFSFVQDTYGIRYLPYHTGVDENFRSAFVRLPGGFYGFVVANSPDLSTSALAKRLLRSWITAMGGTTAQGGVTWPVFQVVPLNPNSNPTSPSLQSVNTQPGWSVEEVETENADLGSVPSGESPDTESKPELGDDQPTIRADAEDFRKVLGSPLDSTSTSESPIVFEAHMIEDRLALTFRTSSPIPDGVTVRVEACGDLEAGVWEPLATWVGGSPVWTLENPAAVVEFHDASGAITVIDSVATTPRIQRYMRLIAVGAQ